MRHRKTLSAAALTIGVLTQAALAAPGDELHKLTASDGAAGDHFGVALAIHGTTLIVGAPFDDDNGSDSGAAYLFNAQTGAQLFKLLPTDGAAGDEFGAAVTILGTTAFVGARLDDDNGVDSGAMYLFDTTTGMQTGKLLPTDGAAGQHFGVSVAADGNTVIVGANASNPGGSAYLFDIATQVQQHKLTEYGFNIGASFGRSVGISGNKALVGEPDDDEIEIEAGSVYFFDVSTGDPIIKTHAYNIVQKVGYGTSIATSGDTIVIGAAASEENCYLLDLNTALTNHHLVQNAASGSESYGRTVSISGDLAIVSAEFRLPGGAAFIFDTNTGQELHELTQSDSVTFSQFGSAVGISGSLAVIGASLDNDSGAAAGAVYIFYAGNPVFAQQPPASTIATLPSLPVDITALADQTQAVTYQWRFNGAPISDTSAYSGTATDTLSIAPSSATEGAYDVVISNFDGSTISDSSTLAVINPLPADINGDGIVDTADLGILIGSFGMMTPGGGM